MGKSKKVSFDIWEFFDSKDIREYHKKCGTEFSPFEKAVLVYHSKRTTVEQKLNAWKELLSTYTEEEFQHVNFTKNSNFEKNNREFVIYTVKAFEKALKGRYASEGFIFETNFWEHGFLRNPEKGYYTNYDDAYDHLKKLKKEYLENENLRKFPTKARIIKRPLNMEDRRDEDMFLFDNELRMVEISADDEYEGLYGKAIFIPLPFKKGDILKDIYSEETSLGILPQEVSWQNVSDIISGLQGEDMIIHLDVFWMEKRVPRKQPMFGYDEFEYLQLEKVAEEEIEDEQTILMLLRDVYQNKMTPGNFLYLYSFHGENAYSAVYGEPKLKEKI